MGLAIRLGLGSRKNLGETFVVSRSEVGRFKRRTKIFIDPFDGCKVG